MVAVEIKGTTLRHSRLLEELKTGWSKEEPAATGRFPSKHQRTEGAPTWGCWAFAEDREEETRESGKLESKG